MTFSDFETTTHAKWILAGEHAVLRGQAALVFPILKKTLNLSYESTQYPSELTCSGQHGHALSALFWDVMHHAAQKLDFPIRDLQGHFSLTNEIPLGIGMGGSAALCVAIARWFVGQSLLQENDCFEFAKHLEHLFHGESSGLDIAGVSHTTGLQFQKGVPTTIIRQAWYPHWYLSSSGKTSVTADCIQRVKALWNDNPLKAASIDEAMGQSVTMAQEALTSTNSDFALNKLKEAIILAANCFEDWGLVDTYLKQQMDALLAEGAIAVKPTGSGKGGYVLSLWAKPPSLLENYIPL